jgi:hypothetical protein
MIPFARRKRRNRDFRPRHAPAPPPPPPATEILVLSATRIDDYFVDFAFSEPVTSVGGVGNAQVAIVTAWGPETPDSAQQVDATTVRFQIALGPILPGQAWQILSVPEGLDFHGREFVVPQNGIVE